MADIELVIKIDENEHNNLIKRAHENIHALSHVDKMILNGTLLPKGHGRLVDIGKIDEDRIERDNPVIYLTVNGECIEAVSLDYLNGLPAIIDADKENK